MRLLLSFEAGFCHQRIGVTPLSDEELKQRNEGPSFTTAEVLAHLEKL